MVKGWTRPLASGRCPMKSSCPRSLGAARSKRRKSRRGGTGVRRPCRRKMAVIVLAAGGARPSREGLAQLARAPGWVLRPQRQHRRLPLWTRPMRRGVGPPRAVRAIRLAGGGAGQPAIAGRPTNLDAPARLSDGQSLLLDQRDEVLPLLHGRSLLPRHWRPLLSEGRCRIRWNACLRTTVTDVPGLHTKKE